MTGLARRDAGKLAGLLAVLLAIAGVAKPASAADCGGASAPETVCAEGGAVRGVVEGA